MSDGSLLALNLAEARDGLARKVFSARELAAAALAIGATPDVSTSFSCSTQVRMFESSPASGSSSASESLIRARVAMCATVALSSAMISASLGYHRS